LLTLEEARAEMIGDAPLVRMRPNCSCRERVAVNVNEEPAAPSEATTCVSTVPSE